MYENIKYYKDIQYRYWKYIDIWIHEIKTNKLSYCQKILVYHQENAIYLWHHYCSTSTVEGSFCGYGVAVSDFKNLVIKWSINDTYIQKDGINQDLGIYDDPDSFFKAFSAI
ncbi:hypothetical protein ACXATD_000431 [Clostridium sporogenes]